MNFINGDFIINELQSVYAPLIEKDLLIIKEDRIRLFDFASSKFKNGFEIKNLNEKNKTRKFDNYASKISFYNDFLKRVVDTYVCIYRNYGTENKFLVKEETLINIINKLKHK